MNTTWPTVALGDVLKERREVPSDIELLTGSIRIVDKVSFNDGHIHFRHSQETKTGMILVRPGDLLVSGINAAKGAIAIYGVEESEPIAATIHYGAYQVDASRAHLKFLWWMLRSNFFRELLSKHVPGGIKTELKSKRLLPIPVPLPSVNEQRRIVARIENLSTKVEEARRTRNLSERELVALGGSYANAVFEDASLPTRPLSDICHIITDGTHQTPRYVDDGAIFLSAQNIKPFKFMPEFHRKVSHEDFAGYTARNKPRLGDVLLTRVGAGIGEAAVVDQDIEFAIYVSLALIRPDTAVLMPQYLVQWLNSPIGRSHSRTNTLGKGHSQGNLNLNLLRSFPVPVPSLDQQMRIVAKLDALQAKVNAVKALQSETAAELDSMLPAILDKAFKGEL